MRQRVSPPFVVPLLLIIGLVLASCTVAPVATTDEAGDTVYTLGVAQPLTGSLGEYGTDFAKGIDLAVEQMNAELAAAGANIQFVTATADTETTPEGAARAVQNLVQTSGAQVIVGPLTTGEVLGAKQFADDNEIVLVAPASSAPSGAIPDDYVFRLFYPPDTYAATAFAQIAAARGYENIVMLAMDDPFGNGMIDAFGANFTGDNVGEIAVVKYAPEPTDVTSEVASVSENIARLSAEGSTAFFCVCFLADAQKVIQIALTDPNMGTVDWLGVENLKNDAILEDAAHAEFLASVGLTSVSEAAQATPNTQPFVDAFVEKYGTEPGSFTNYAYDSAMVAMLSMLSGGNSGPAVKSILPYIATHYIGTSVQATLDDNGDQAVVFYGIYQLNPEGTEFVQIGTFDGATGQATVVE
jgi:branched-chain amino acid transport system substrate-binding protein